MDYQIVICGGILMPPTSICRIIYANLHVSRLCLHATYLHVYQHAA